jgi:hypothetical protein
MSFAVIIPYLPDQTGWCRVQASRFGRAHALIPQGEHGYFEGSQHDRITRYRVAPFDTSVFFLQNDAGFKVPPCAHDAETRSLVPARRLPPPARRR